MLNRNTVAAVMRMSLQREPPQAVLQAQWHSPVQTHLSLLITNIFEYQPLLKTHHSRGELLHLTARVSLMCEFMNVNVSANHMFQAFLLPYDFFFFFLTLFICGPCLYTNIFFYLYPLSFSLSLLHFLSCNQPHLNTAVSFILFLS